MRRNVLLLQGPVGPFFRNFAQELEHNGFCVYKINFNGGDKLYFSGERVFDYRDTLTEWRSYLERFLQTYDIGRIYLFGDCRFYHKVARTVAEENNVRLFVFEEGYIRPNFITLEETGVNGYSALLDKTLDLSKSPLPEEYPQKFLDRVFRNMVVYAMSYYLASSVLSFRFPDYVHHRPLAPLSEGGKWLLSVFRKAKYQLQQKHLIKRFAGSLHDRYFLCPLQVHCDMQITAHSDFTSVEHFIGEVVASFAKHADPRHSLVFKHHPMDRGYTNYSTLIEKLAHEYGVENRLYYVHDLDLPAMLKSARGTVLINSTVGMSSLLHDTPVKTLGRAIYDRAELTSQVDLDEFWLNPGGVDKQAYAAFRDHLILKNQINGSFYRRLSGINTPTGLEWTLEMLQDHRFTPDRVDSSKRPTLQVVAGRDLDSQTVERTPPTPGKVASR
ncbi:MAG: capsular biosynthesis protein [Gammaproteobacteria bacterium]|nr:capsular biosynthesis protein [Gammaproteobacteria bacterium]